MKDHTDYEIIAIWAAYNAEQTTPNIYREVVRDLLSAFTTQVGSIHDRTPYPSGGLTRKAYWVVGKSSSSQPGRASAPTRRLAILSRIDTQSILYSDVSFRFEAWVDQQFDQMARDRTEQVDPEDGVETIDERKISNLPK